MNNKELNELYKNANKVMQQAKPVIDVYNKQSDKFSKIFQIAIDVYNVLSSVGISIIENNLKINQKLIEIISDIKLPEFTDDEKNRIIEAYQNWGEYGWTIFPFVKYNFYNSCPDNLIEADKKVLKECNKHNLSLLFERLNDFELINKKDLEESIFCFENKKYKSCAMVLYSIIDAKLIKMQKDEDRNPRNHMRATGKNAALNIKKHIEKENNINDTFFLLLSHVNLFSCIDTLFQHGDDFKKEPELANRNFLDHGMLKKNVRRKDCIKLFLLLYNLMSYLEIVCS